MNAFDAINKERRIRSPRFSERVAAVVGIRISKRPKGGSTRQASLGGKKTAVARKLKPGLIYGNKKTCRPGLFIDRWNWTGARNAGGGQFRHRVV